MRKERIDNKWQPWRWVLHEVVLHDEGFGTEPRRILNDEREQRWLHPNFTVELFRDEAEGYYLNATTPAPAWFVLWRMDDEPTLDDAPIARPHFVTLSYNEAARWLDAQETVEHVPAPPDVVEWMHGFALGNYVPEPRKRKRPESFKPLTDRFGNPASVSTGKRYGGDGGHG
jgi:hypothetical protein